MVRLLDEHLRHIIKPLYRANLNKSYFTNRQDRYIHFKEQPSLAQYCFSFLDVISQFSYKLLPTTTEHSNEGYRVEWPDTATHPHGFQSKAESALAKLQASYLTPKKLTSDSQSTLESDVLVFPVLQGGQFNIREEENSLSMLFRHLSTQEVSASCNPIMDLTSGYFGLYKPYQDFILNSSIDCRIIAASPKVSSIGPPG